MTYVKQKVSLKFRLLSFLGAVAVVIIHSNSLETMADPLWAGRLGNWIGYLQRWAVPYFFVLSGFFFDRGYASCDRETVAFFSSKLRSLVVPYLLWGTVYGALTMTPILMYVNGTHETALFQGTILKDFSAWGIVDRVVGFTSDAPPNGALWYVRLCLVFFLLAPIWRFIRRHAIYAFPCAAVVCVFFGNPFVRGYHTEHVVLLGQTVHASLLGVGYLFLGMSASIFQAERVRVSFVCAFAMFLCWMVWTHVTIESCLRGSPAAQGFVVWNHKVSGLLLIGVMWYAVDVALPLLSIIRPEIIGFSFWIYCMHHPITGYVGALCHAVFGRSLSAEVVRMFVSMPITLTFCIGCGLIVRRNFPCVFSVLVGGRKE